MAYPPLPKIVKRALPGRLKTKLKETWSGFELARAVRQIAGLKKGQAPDRTLLGNLRDAWGNEGFAARIVYLEEVAAYAAQTPGPILECGSGLTTILLGLLAARRGVEVWSLENIPEWHAHVSATLRRCEISGVQVCLSPLVSYGDFDWYQPPIDSLPREFRMVVCDGPSRGTRGGRYGLLPILGRRLPSGTVILLDDAARASEAENLRRWEAEANMRVCLRESAEGTFAVVTAG